MPMRSRMYCMAKRPRKSCMAFFLPPSPRFPITAISCIPRPVPFRCMAASLKHPQREALIITMKNASPGISLLVVVMLWDIPSPLLKAQMLQPPIRLYIRPCRFLSLLRIWRARFTPLSPHSRLGVLRMSHTLLVLPLCIHHGIAAELGRDGMLTISPTLFRALEVFCLPRMVSLRYVF